MASITTKHDKDVSNKILIMPAGTFYGVWRAAIKLATYEQRQALDLAIPRLLANRRASEHDVFVSDKILRTEGITFYAALLALISMADTHNLAQLQSSFPGVVREAKIRYYAPGACVSVDEWREVNPDEVIPDNMLEAMFVNAIAKADGQAIGRSSGKGQI